MTHAKRKLQKWLDKLLVISPMIFVDSSYDYDSRKIFWSGIIVTPEVKLQMLGGCIEKCDGSNNAELVAAQTATKRFKAISDEKECVLYTDSDYVEQRFQEEGVTAVRISKKGKAPASKILHIVDVMAWIAMRKNRKE